jgi:hypothetical protein
LVATPRDDASLGVPDLFANYLGGLSIAGTYSAKNSRLAKFRQLDMASAGELGFPAERFRFIDDFLRSSIAGGDLAHDHTHFKAKL